MYQPLLRSLYCKQICAYCSPDSINHRKVMGPAFPVKLAVFLLNLLYGRAVHCYVGRASFTDTCHNLAGKRICPPARGMMVEVTRLNPGEKRYCNSAYACLAISSSSLVGMINTFVAAVSVLISLIPCSRLLFFS